MSGGRVAAVVRLEPWGAGDLPLLLALLGDPAMMEHLGGPESRRQIADRQRRYQRAGSKQYKIVEPASGEGVGWVGYWAREWRGSPVYEIGWSVLPAAQGRGLATAATREAVALARADGDRRWMHAYPSVDNAPSNAVCRKLGFTLLGPEDFEYPKGHPLRCNDWRLDLFASA
jgi:RimJ/RimL family protein N-acetyltransferase